MDNKFVITIGRQFGSCGKEIGQELAKRFGITFYDKELISLASKESGLCQEFFEKADEKNSGNLLQAFAAGFTFGPFQYNDFLYILRDNKRCINVFVHADIEERVKTVMNRQHISEQEARELIRKMDKTRPNYYNFYSDKEWGVASSYHLSVDSSLLGVHKTVDFIQKFVEEALKD